MHPTRFVDRHFLFRCRTQVHRIAASAVLNGHALLNRIKVRSKLIVFPGLERIVLVIVAAAAVEGEAEPDGPGSFDAVLYVFDARFLGDTPALAVEHVVAM